ncbi:anti-sigma factor family protein, partial [Deinococcus pimensis]|uniref:anti-sigma factor family protein n=1 Tax=Deinococcus pimensis TaxID=309888 RepID=UPI0004876286
MHKLLDGELGEAERAELQALLARDPTARAEFERLRAVHAALADLPRLSAPPGIARAVVSDIRTSRALRETTMGRVPSVAALVAAR